LSLMRASSVRKRQSILPPVSSRRSLDSISAMLSQLPCFWAYGGSPASRRGAWPPSDRMPRRGKQGSVDLKDILHSDTPPSLRPVRQEKQLERGQFVEQLFLDDLPDIRHSASASLARGQLAPDLVDALFAPAGLLRRARAVSPHRARFLSQPEAPHECFRPAVGRCAVNALPLATMSPLSRRRTTRPPRCASAPVCAERRAF